MIASAQHGPGPFPPKSNVGGGLVGRAALNPLNYSPATRALWKQVDEKGGFDLAILDVNLKGENVWPVASALREKNVPFVIATGGHVDPPPPEFNDAPVIEKPYTVDRVTPAIEAALTA